MIQYKQCMHAIHIYLPVPIYLIYLGIHYALHVAVADKHRAPTPLVSVILLETRERVTHCLVGAKVNHVKQRHIAVDVR